MTRQHRGKIIGMVWTLLCAAVLFPMHTGNAAFAQALGKETEIQYEQVDVLRIGEGDSGYPTPWKRGRKGGGSRKVMLIYDSLLEKDAERLIPWLAQEYEIKENGKQYLFTLREGVKWHDGTDFSAEDVKFTFEYLKQHPMVESPVSKHDVETVDILNPHQVLITVASVGAPLLENIGTVPIVPKHVWEQVEAPDTFEAAAATVGTGPYRLIDYSKSKGTYKYEAFADFWGPRPGAKMLLWFPVPDDVLALEAGAIDIARGLSHDLIATYQSNPEYAVVCGPAFSGNRVLFNLHNVEILRQKAFRQAIAYATDTREFIAKLGRGAGEPGNAGLLPPAHIMYNPTVKQYPLDLEKCAELVHGLGYATLNEQGIRVNARGETLSFKLLVSEKSLRSAELLREQLLRAGIDMVIQAMDGKAQETKVREGDFEIAVVGHAGLGGDADYLRERFAVEEDMGGAGAYLSTKGYVNEELFRLLNTQRELTDFDARKTVVGKIQEIIAEDVPEIPLYYSYDYTLYKPAKYRGWMHEYDERNFTGAKLSYVLYDLWKRQ